MGPTNDDVLPAVITAIRPGRIPIEKIHGPFLFEFKGSPGRSREAAEAATTRAQVRGFFDLLGPLAGSPDV
jgi:hypothetical protein